MENKNNKTIIKKFFYCPICLYFLLDKWLTKMSLKGSHLIDHGAFRYVFEIDEPYKQVFFTYAPTGHQRSEGKYSISLRYPLLYKQFGKSHKKSKLNNLNQKRIASGKTIIEIDESKINEAYEELVSDRNRLHFLYTIRGIIIFAVAIALLVLVLSL